MEHLVRERHRDHRLSRNREPAAVQEPGRVEAIGARRQQRFAGVLAVLQRNEAERRDRRQEESHPRDRSRRGHVGLFLRRVETPTPTRPQGEVVVQNGRRRRTAAGKTPGSQDVDRHHPGPGSDRRLPACSETLHPRRSSARGRRPEKTGASSEPDSLRPARHRKDVAHRHARGGDRRRTARARGGAGSADEPRRRQGPVRQAPARRPDRDGDVPPEHHLRGLHRRDPARAARWSERGRGRGAAG